MCFHNITSLSASKEYQFRVIAENFYGKSDPCEPTAVIKTDESDAIKKKKAMEGILSFFLLNGREKIIMW